MKVGEFVVVFDMLTQNEIRTNVAGRRRDEKPERLYVNSSPKIEVLTLVAEDFQG